VLIVDDPFAPEMRRAARNLGRITLQEAVKLNTLDLCQYRKIVMSTKALEKIIARATNGGN
jgi:large subunit ribosomal protein L4